MRVMESAQWLGVEMKENEKPSRDGPFFIGGFEMQVVSDRAMDLSDEQMHGLDVHLVPLTFTLDG